MPQQYWYSLDTSNHVNGGPITIMPDYINAEGVTVSHKEALLALGGCVSEVLIETELEWPDYGGHRYKHSPNANVSSNIVEVEHDLDLTKTKYLEMLLWLSYNESDKVYPRHKLLNAALGLYSVEVTNAMKTHIGLYIAEYDRVKALILAAASVAGVKTAFASASWPQPPEQ